MIKYLFGTLLVLTSLHLQAQNSRMMARYVQEIRETTDPFLKDVSMEVPDEYKDASAVALAVISLDAFEGNSKKRLRNSFYRLFLKINDKAARDKFSTFSFENNSFRYFGYRDEKIYMLRIIKASGEEIDIDVESLEKNADGEVAIPNLEIGDILDYGLKVVETIYSSDCYDPQLKTLNDDFPIVHGFQRYTVERGFFVNFMSQNGAPSLTRNEELSDRKTLVYDLEYSNLKPISGEVWAPQARTEETLKIQICYYSMRHADKAPLILGSPYEVKTSSTDEEKMRALKAEHNFSYTGGYDSNKFFDKWYKKNFPNGSELSNEEYMNYAFYHYRYFTLVFDPQLNSYRENYSTSYLKPKFFMLVMKDAAMNKGIPFEIVFSTNKDISSLDDVLLISEFSYIGRYATESGEWKYIENPYSFQTSDYISPKLQGQDAFAMDYKGNFTRIVIPESEPDDNLYRLNFTIDPNLEDKNASVDVTSTTTGIFKYDFSRSALQQVEFHEDAQTATLPDGKEDVILEKGRTQRGILSSQEKVEKDPEEKLQMMKKLRSEDFDIDEYTSFEVLDSGVKSAQDSLIYRENYSIKDVIEKAGPSYIINLSKIALDQISFTDEEKAERRNDIYINYPKTYEYFYRINIPEGYKAFGLESFKESVESKYGSVEMNAEEKDNQVVVYLKKVYKESFVPNEEWPTMMEFLEPAMKINDARIVLKKG